MATIRNYYADVFSSQGYFSLFDEALKGLSHIYVLKGAPGTGKSTLMRKIGVVLMEEGFSLEYYHSPTDNQSVTGLLLPELSIGMIAGSAALQVDFEQLSANVKIVDLEKYLDVDQASVIKEKVIKYEKEKETMLQEVYQSFKAAKKVHLQKEEIYLSRMDFAKADEVTEKLIKDIFSDSPSEGGEGQEKRIFFGAATPKGVINFIDNLTADASKRYIIKGRPGSGKSTMMKKIVAKGKELGYSIDIFPCGFDPDSLDMVWIDELKVAVLDGTAPHEIEPFRSEDSVVDMFEQCIDPDVETEYEEELKQLDLKYKSLMTEATNYLSEASRLEKVIASHYSEAMDFQKVKEEREKVLGRILHRASSKQEKE